MLLIVCRFDMEHSNHFAGERQPFLKRFFARILPVKATSAHQALYFVSLDDLTG